MSATRVDTLREGPIAGRIEDVTNPSDEEVLAFAIRLSVEAGRLILPLWKNTTVAYKPDGSEVTEADRSAEKLLRRRIHGRFPDHSILGEEYGGESNREAEHLWLIDPIDGTASFSIGLPLFGTLIGYLRGGRPSVGVIGAHALGETVYAAEGQGCWLLRERREPQRIRTSAAANLEEAIMVSTGLEHTDLDPRDPAPFIRLSRLYRQARRFRWSGDCVNYALLCQGRIDVALDPRMNPWDIAALAPCVREAGGMLTSFDGSQDVVWQQNLVASANPTLHAKVLRSLRTS